MFVRIKSKSKDKYNKSVQLVESSRVNGKVVQTIVKHIGVAYNDEQLDELRLLAKSIQITLENVDKESLFQAEELIEDLTLEGKYDQSIYSDEDYNVDIRNLEEESRTITGIHDIYGKLYDELKVGSIIANPARNVSVAKIFKEMVISRIANPDSKRGSVAALEEKYGVEIDLDKVYRMMDKLDDIAIAKLNTLSYEPLADYKKQPVI